MAATAPPLRTARRRRGRPRMAEVPELRHRNRAMLLLFVAGLSYLAIRAIWRCDEKTVWRALRDAAGYPELEPYREQLRERLRLGRAPEGLTLAEVLGPILPHVPRSPAYLN